MVSVTWVLLVPVAAELEAIDPTVPEGDVADGPRGRASEPPLAASKTSSRKDFWPDWAAPSAVTRRPW